MASNDSAMRHYGQATEEAAALRYLDLHKASGAAYLSALRKLGLDPECLLWAHDDVVGQMVLVLVTSQFERVGPLELSKLLFKAHNLAGTPPEISPFIVRLHSPEQALIQEMDRTGLGEFVRKPPLLKPPSEGGPTAVFVEAGGMRFKVEWVYKWHIPRSKPNAVDLRRRWKRFTENVDRLAA